MTRLQAIMVTLVTAALATNCGNSNQAPHASPLAPSSSPATTLFGGLSTFGGHGRVGTEAVPFPPQNEPVDFLAQLETHYRVQLGKPPLQTFVDVVGHAVWMQDYLRYRLNQCSHPDAVSKTLLRVDTRGAVDPPECGTAGSGQLPFPPQNESLDFLNQLERKYQTQGGRYTTNVDATGHAAWMADYLRYRVNKCEHFDSINKVFTIVDTTVQGRTVIPPDCTNNQPPPTARIDVSGTCEANAPDNTLTCSIRATTTGQISSYRWSLRVKTDYPQPNAPALTNIGCNFPAAGGSYPETINLQVTGPTGSATAAPVNVTIFKGPRAC